MNVISRPEWLTIPAPEPESLERMQQVLDAGHLHTVCEGADCPNIGECFASRTCTFMILGSVCTRNCTFCAVEPGRPAPVDPGEPRALALTARQLGLRHVVITSVTRDDLPDGGAGHFAATIRAVRGENPGASVEVLIPDFQGREDALRIVLAARPDVVNHNVETVPRLYREVRPQAVYERSLELLSRVARAGAGVRSKSGLMLGLGERREEVIRVMQDLHAAQCQILTLGQYLRPSPAHHPVCEYIHPDSFRSLEEEAERIGFHQVMAGPLVRSSYHAARIIDRLESHQEKGARLNDDH